MNFLWPLWQRVLNQLPGSCLPFSLHSFVTFQLLIPLYIPERRLKSAVILRSCVSVCVALMHTHIFLVSRVILGVMVDILEDCFAGTSWLSSGSLLANSEWCALSGIEGVFMNHSVLPYTALCLSAISTRGKACREHETTGELQQRTEAGGVSPLPFCKLCRLQ